MKKISAYFIIILSTPLLSFICCAQTIPLKGKFTARNGNNENAIITISKNNATIKTIPVLNSSFDFQLGLTQYFIITFSKPGYISKKYFIDTHTPQDVNSKDFAPIVFDVELKKQTEGQKNNAQNQPGGFRYMKEIEGFGYDPGYAVEGESLESENKVQTKEKPKEENKTLELPEKHIKTKPQEESSKQKTIANADTESEKRKTYYTDLPDSRSEETSNDGKKTTTTITIIKSNIKTVYTKVVHAWGGVFFFMNGESITEAEFNQRTK